MNIFRTLTQDSSKTVAAETIKINTYAGVGHFYLKKTIETFKFMSRVVCFKFYIY
jgi:hypothetical protein